MNEFGPAGRLRCNLEWRRPRRSARVGAGAAVGVARRPEAAVGASVTAGQHEKCAQTRAGRRARILSPEKRARAAVAVAVFNLI
jgi:hypothetical protein